MKELTNRQQEVLCFIRNYVSQHSCPPTVRETAHYFEISLKAVQDHFGALRKKGYIDHAEGRSRAIKVLVDEDGMAVVPPKNVPVLGTVAAGKPIFCEKNYDGTIAIPGYMVQRGASYFAVYVRGDSMINAGIMDGDTAIIRKQNHASDGAIVLAFIEEKVTLKRFFKEATRIRLEPANEAYKPIFCQNLHVLGVLSNIIRNY